MVDEIEDVFDNFSWMFGVIIVIFVLIFVAVLVSIIVAIVRKSRYNGGMNKNTPPPTPRAPQKKRRSDIDPFGIDQEPVSPFAEIEDRDQPTLYAPFVAATQTDSEPTDEPTSCPFCGAPREPGKFCPFCGNKYEDK